MKAVQARVPVDEPVTEAVLERALARGRKLVRPGINATSFRYEAECLSIGFADGSRVMLPATRYPEFSEFCVLDFNELELGFAGSALCHERLDLHVSIASLLSMSTPLMDMAATLIASRNGRQSSTRKAQAARANGKKGGRPRKVEPIDE